jgi:hypothetical protein
MGQQLPPDQKELYRRVDEVLHYLWDPVGVAAVPEARDEYYSYLPRVFSLLTTDAPPEDIISFLVTTQTDAMGVGSSGACDRAAEVVDVLRRWRRVIAERAPTA